MYSVAVCSGSGSSLLNAFLASRAQVYVTGDLRYHDARTAEAAGRGLVDIGHFASEHLMVKVLADMLRSRLREAEIDIRGRLFGRNADRNAFHRGNCCVPGTEIRLQDQRAGSMACRAF